jgi:hypothetical protein
MVARVEQELHAPLIASELLHEGVSLRYVFGFFGLQEESRNVVFFVADESLSGD